IRCEAQSRGRRRPHRRRVHLCLLVCLLCHRHHLLHHHHCHLCHDYLRDGRAWTRNSILAIAQARARPPWRLQWALLRAYSWWLPTSDARGCAAIASAKGFRGHGGVMTRRSLSLVAAPLVAVFFLSFLPLLIRSRVGHVGAAFVV